MTGRFDAAYYEELRGRVRGILIAVADQLPVQTVRLVDELIDANESGIALEMLSEMLVEAQAQVTADVIDQVDRLAREMGLSQEVAERVRGLGPK